MPPSARPEYLGYLVKVGGIEDDSKAIAAILVNLAASQSFKLLANPEALGAGCQKAIAKGINVPMTARDDLQPGAILSAVLRRIVVARILEFALVEVAESRHQVHALGNTTGHLHGGASFHPTRIGIGSRACVSPFRQAPTRRPELSRRADGAHAPA
ncbi:MAG: hypothetical protein HY000_20190 [Planctomycetes bacterium]|nr:hypothetical protein [Planctomycetota bacterium]